MIRSVCGFGADAPLIPSTALATYEVGPALYLRTVRIVHTASWAVNGTPSDHFPFRRWNVQVSPFLLCDQLDAQSPAILGPGSYWTSCGKIIV